MDQSNLKPPAGAKHKKKRVGCGDGSGHGTFSTRGCKGQKSRSGRDLRPGFEGGQLPIIKRLPWTRGFTNVAKIEYSLVNVGDLKLFDANTEVSPEVTGGIGPGKICLGCRLRYSATANWTGPLTVKGQ